MKTTNKKYTITTALLLSLLLLFTACSTDETTSSAGSEATIETTTEATGNTYTDGTYTGVAQGFGDNLTVEVILANNLITSIEVVSHNEQKEEFYGQPIATIPGEIITAQDPIVDVISGATFTSSGIMNATINALSQALETGELPDTLELPANSGKKH